LNRDAARADRAPELYDLRDSGSIEQDADIVLMLETDAAIEPTTGLHDINIWIRKNRQYKKDLCVKVRPNKTYSHFEEVSVEAEAEPEELTDEDEEDNDKLPFFK
jgi:replicative DNA helicase